MEFEIRCDAQNHTHKETIPHDSKALSLRSVKKLLLRIQLIKLSLKLYKGQVTSTKRKIYLVNASHIFYINYLVL